MYCVVTDVDYKSSRTGNVYGKMFGRNVRGGNNTLPLRVRNGSKRSVWRYEVPEEGEVVLDNGMVYSMKEIKVVVERRRKAEEMAKKNENGENQEVEGEKQE